AVLTEDAAVSLEGDGAGPDVVSVAAKRAKTRVTHAVQRERFARDDQSSGHAERATACDHGALSSRAERGGVRSRQNSFADGDHARKRIGAFQHGDTKAELKQPGWRAAVFDGGVNDEPYRVGDDERARAAGEGEMAE